MSYFYFKIPIVLYILALNLFITYLFLHFLFDDCGTCSQKEEALFPLCHSPTGLEDFPAGTSRFCSFSDWQTLITNWMKSRKQKTATFTF